MNNFTIKGEHTRPDKRLCDTCHHSIISRGPQQGQEIVRCNYGGMDAVVLKFPVVECNVYSRMGELSKYEAETIGWILEVKGGRVMGFKPPKKDD